MFSTQTTKDQLEVVLERIQSRQYFLVVVQHLLSELRNPARRSSYSSSSGSIDSTPTTPPTLSTTTVRRLSLNQTRADVQTLATLLDDGKKRKRSITHFEGIPLSLIRPEIKAPTNRRVATSRRMRELERTMAKLCCESSEDMVCHFPFCTAVADDRPTRMTKAKTKATMTTLLLSYDSMFPTVQLHATRPIVYNRSRRCKRYTTFSVSNTASRAYHLLQSQNCFPSLVPLQTREMACTHPHPLLLAM